MIDIDHDNTIYTIYWRGGYGCVSYEIERNLNDNQGWKSIVTGINDFTGKYEDNNINTCNFNCKQVRNVNATDKQKQCIDYKIRGYNVDAMTSDFSSIYQVCS